MKLTSVRLQPEGEFAEIVWTCDLHAGAATFDEKRARKHRSYILESPDRWTIDGGDTTENCLKGSVGNVYEQTMSPQDQEEWAEDYWLPVAESSKLLGILNSNHAYRSQREADHSPTRHLCRYLRVPFLGWSHVFRVKVGENHKRSYNIFVTHGASGARKPSSRMNTLIGLTDVVEGCDVYLMGHLHNAMTFSRQVQRPAKDSIVEITQHFGMGGSFVDWNDSYGEMKLLQPPDSSMVAVRLFKSSPKVEVSLLPVLR